LTAALEEAIRLTSGAGNGTLTRTRSIEEWRRLDRLFRSALDAARAAPQADADYVVKLRLPSEAREWWDSLTDDERFDAWRIENDNALRAALAAAPVVPAGLDVETLAMALVVVFPPAAPGPAGTVTEGDIIAATQLAAEYGRLRADPR